MVTLNLGNGGGVDKKIVNFLLVLLCVGLAGFILLQATAISYLIILELRT